MRAVVETARELGIPYLTLFVFSNENWQRPSTEVRFLMQLLHRYLMTETKRLMKRGIRLIAVGDTARLPAPVRPRAGADNCEPTAGNRRMTVALALSYGGRQDIIGGASDESPLRSRPARSARANRRATARGVAGDRPGCRIRTCLIRTSGEQRISNFFLYQLAYTELYFTETLWPDFREREFLSALAAYQARERRFGTIDPQNQRLRAAN